MGIVGLAGEVGSLLWRVQFTALGTVLPKAGIAMC